MSLGVPVSWAIVTDSQQRAAMGTALTPWAEDKHQTQRFQGLANDWINWALADLPERILADAPLERCLALAAINAVSQYRLMREQLAGVDTHQQRPDLVHWITTQQPKRLVMIGNMRPLTEGLKQAGIIHRVFERNPDNHANALSDAQEWGWLAQADSLVITGATLLNHTLSPILHLTPQAKWRILVGFSAQIHPEFMQASGITHLFSVHIQDIAYARRQLQIGRWNALFETQIGYWSALKT